MVLLLHPLYQRCVETRAVEKLRPEQVVLRGVVHMQAV